MSDTQGMSVKLLDIKFADNKGVNFVFYVRSITLDEALSRPYKAVLTVLTTEYYSLDTMAKLLGNSANVTITQYTDTNASCTRYLSGEVASFKDKGVISVSTGDTKDVKSCIQYELTIEPPLSRMKLNKKTRVFNNLNVFEVINSIAKEYDIKFEYEKDFQSKKFYYNSKDVIFQQYKESDFDFINRLLLAYGMNYYFEHSSSGFVPKVYLTDGEGFKPVSNITLSNNQKVPSPLACSTNSSAGSSFVISDWQIEESSYCKDVESIADSMADMFEYSRSYGDGAEIIMKSVIRKNMKNALRRTRSSWSGKGGNLALCIGSKFYIGGISLKSGDKYSGIISSSLLEYNASWPANMAMPPTAVAGEQPLVQIIDGYTIERSGTDGSLIPHTFFPSEETVSALGNLYVRQAAPFTAVKAIVCGKNGKLTVETTNRDVVAYDSSAPSKCYALIQGMKESADGKATVPVEVNIVMPIGGKKSGLFYFPRIGDNVFLAFSGGKYYLLGYMSLAEEMQGFDEGIKTDMLNTTALQCYESDKIVHGIKMTSSNSELDNIACHIMDGSIDYLIEKSVIRCNDSSLGTEYERFDDSRTTSLRLQCKNVRNDIELASKTLSLTRSSYIDLCRTFHTTLSSSDTFSSKDVKEALENIEIAKKAIESAKANVESKKTILNKLAATLWKNITDTEKNALAKKNAKITDDAKKIPPQALLEHGNTSRMDISSAENLNISSGKSTNIFTSGTSSIFADKNITINSKDDDIEIIAGKSIKLVVGDNIININREGISLMSRRFAHASGPFDAELSLNSLRGSKLTGSSVSISSFMNTGISDSLGGSVGIKGGSVSVSGNTISLDTNPGFMAIANIITEATQCTIQAASLAKGCKTNCEYASTTFDLLGSIPNRVVGFINRHNSLKEHNANKAKIWATGLIPDILNLIANILDTATSYADTAERQGLKTMLPGEVSGKDALRLASMAAKIAAVGMGMGGLIGKMKMLHGTSISMSGTYKCETTEVKVVAIKRVDASSLVSGLVGDDEGGEGQVGEDHDVEEHDDAKVVVPESD